MVSGRVEGWAAPRVAGLEALGTISAMKKQILGSLLVLLCGMAMLLSGCGQKGDLFIPNDPEAKDRAPFPQVLLPPTP